MRDASRSTLHARLVGGRSIAPVVVAVLLLGLQAALAFWMVARAVAESSDASGPVPPPCFAPAGKLIQQFPFELPAGKAGAPSHGWVRVFESISSSPNWGGRSDLEVVVDGERVFAMHASPMRLAPLGEADAPPVDLTGDGVVDIAVRESTMQGSRQNWAQLHVLQLRPAIRLQTIDLPGGGHEFVPAQRGAPVEIRVGDGTFDLSLHDEPFFPRELPTVVLKYDGNEWKPSAASTRKPLEAFSDLAWQAPDSMSPWEPATAGGPADPRFLEFGDWGQSSALALIYAGHADQAWKAFEALWPSHPQWPRAARRLMIKTLKESPYWPTLVEMNGSALDD